MKTMTHTLILSLLSAAAVALLLSVFVLYSTDANAGSLQGTNPTLVINEVDADTPSTDVAEFIELFDGGSGNSTLDGYTLVLFNGSNNESYLAIDLDGYSTDANGYFVLGNSAIASAVITFANATMQQGPDAVALYQDDAANFPNGTAVTTANLIDALVYDTNDADDAELLTLLNAGQPQVNEGGGGSSPDHSNQRCANGSGGQRNTSSYVQIPPSPGTTNNCGAVEPTATPTPTSTPIVPTPTSSITPETGLLINEVDVDTPSTDTAEFVELYDGGSGNTPLDGLAIVLFNGSNNESYLAIDLDGLSTNGDGYLVAGNPAVASAAITFATSSMQNGPDAVALYVGSASDFPNGTAVTTDNLLDAVVYGNDAANATLLSLLQAGQTEMNEAGARNADAVSMARCPNGSGAQRTTNTLALVSPSPNEPNNCGSPLPTLTPTATPSAPTATPTLTATPTVDNSTPTPTPVVAAVLINEIDADNSGEDTSEFVELYGVPGASLDGLCWVAINGSNDRVYRTIDLAGSALNSGGFFVIGNASVANVGVTFPDASLQNGPDAVAIIAADDCGAAISNSTTVTDVLQMRLIDAVVYGINDDDDPELLTLLNAGQTQLNEDGAGDNGAHANARCPEGAGGARNSDHFVQVVPSPGSANDCAGVPTPTPTVMLTPLPTATATATATSTPVSAATATATPTATPIATPTIDSRTGNDETIYLPIVQR